MADAVVVTAPAAGTPWFTGVAGVDADMTTYFTARGIDKLQPAQAAVELAKAHRAAESKLGIPADQILRMPKDAGDTEGWKALHTKLGVPGDPKDYDFSTVKGADGTALPQAVTDWLRATAVKLNLPKDAAVAFATDFQKHQADGLASTKAEFDGKLVAQKVELEKNWGVNKDANLFIAKQAAKALGVDPETIAALEGQIGYSKVMEMFRSIGTKIGEDKYISGNSTNAGVMTRDQAQVRKSELMADTAWRDRYMAGGTNEAKEMTALNTLIVS